MASSVTADDSNKIGSNEQRSPETVAEGFHNNDQPLLPDAEVPQNEASPTSSAATGISKLAGTKMMQALSLKKRHDVMMGNCGFDGLANPIEPVAGGLRFRKLMNFFKEPAAGAAQTRKCSNPQLAGEAVLGVGTSGPPRKRTLTLASAVALAGS
jgi:hypothetical protein